MSNIAIQRRRGTTLQHSTFTGLLGEITVDTSKVTLVIHDGSTVGGNPIAKTSLVTSVSSSYTISANQQNAAIDIYTGTNVVNITLPTASSVGNGWGCSIRKADSASGSIHFVTSLLPANIVIASQNISTYVWTDGTNWYHRDSFGYLDTNSAANIPSNLNVTGIINATSTTTTGALYSQGAVVTLLTTQPVSSVSSNAYITNHSAFLQPTLTLPSATGTGAIYTFIVENTNGYKIVAAGTDTIQYNSSTSAAGGNLQCTTIGSVVRLLNTGSGRWVCIDIVGTWTVT